MEDAPTPTCLTELKSYLGHLTYYSKFLPNLSTYLAPMYEKMYGVMNRRKHFTIKNEADFIKSSGPFQPKSNSSSSMRRLSYDIGAVLTHRLPDGSEKPVGYVSYTEQSREKLYSTREGRLARVFEVNNSIGHSFELKPTI